MIAKPSATAYRVALRRAAHQVLDPAPLIFADPLAMRIVGPEGSREIAGSPERFEQPAARMLRAFLVMRSRFAEDAVAAAVARGVRQYVLLGAGLDTFAYRNPHASVGLPVFEVDHPATQAWKRERLAAAGIAAFESRATFAAVDFERETVADGLSRSGFEWTQPAVFAWLGVVPYLTRAAVSATLEIVGGRTAAGSEIVFDYAESPDRLDPVRRGAFEVMARRVASIGEPFITFFAPAEVAGLLGECGFGRLEDLDADALNARYRGLLRVGGIGHLMRACV